MAKKFIDANAFLQRMIEKYHCKPMLDGAIIILRELIQLI